MGGEREGRCEPVQVHIGDSTSRDERTQASAPRTTRSAPPPPRRLARRTASHFSSSRSKGRGRIAPMEDAINVIARTDTGSRSLATDYSVRAQPGGGGRAGCESEGGGRRRKRGANPRKARGPSSAARRGVPPRPPRADSAFAVPFQRASSTCSWCWAPHSASPLPPQIFRVLENFSQSLAERTKVRARRDARARGGPLAPPRVPDYSRMLRVGNPPVALALPPRRVRSPSPTEWSSSASSARRRPRASRTP